MWHSSLSSDLPPLPAALQVAAGAGVAGASGEVEEGCAGDLTITNTSATALQITQFGVIYSANSVENTYSFRLLDACDLLKLSDCGGLGGSGCPLASSMTLSAGPAGKMVTEPVGMCPPSGIGSTLAPAETAVLKIGFNSPALSYRVHLVLGITTAAAGATLVTLPASFDSTLVFVAPDSPNMTCYRLQGNTFAPLPHLVGDDNLREGGKRLCV
jgi:hypothetical protein